MKKLLALLAVLGLATVVSATPVMNVVDGGTVSVGGVAYHKFSLNYLLDTTTEAAPNAWDVKVSSATKNIGIDVGFWDFDYDLDTGNPIDGTYAPRFEAYKSAPVGSTALGVTSSGVYLGTQQANFAGLDTDVTGQFNTDFWNVAFAYAGGRRSLTPVATVYLLDNTQATVSFKIGYGGNGGEKFDVGSQVIGVPEPATMGLLAIGALGLIRRKLA